jgi:hypothetical protein
LGAIRRKILFEITRAVSAHGYEGFGRPYHVEQFAVEPVVIDVGTVFFTHPHGAIARVDDRLVIDADVAIWSNRQIRQQRRRRLDARGVEASRRHSTGFME